MTIWKLGGGYLGTTIYSTSSLAELLPSLSAIRACDLNPFPNFAGYATSTSFLLPAMASPTPEAAEPAVVFRPGKKRKAYRQRSEDSEAPTPEPSNEKSTVTSGKGDDGSLEARDTPQLDLTEEGLSVAEVIRRRNARKARLGGVAFRAEPASKSAAQDAAVAHELSTDQSLVAHEGGGGAVDTSTGGIVKRFASQTGLVGELVNKHM